MHPEILHDQTPPLPITVEAMCAAMPQVFRIGATARPPLQTAQQWDRAQKQAYA